MGKISELPVLERPREKAIRYGISSLSDAELLAIIINNGYKGKNALDISHELLSKYRGLLGLYESDNDLDDSLKGMGDKKILSLQTAFELHRRISKKESDEKEAIIDSEYLYNRYKSEFIKQDQEQMLLVVTNKNNRIIHEKMVYQGTKDNIIFSYIDIWKYLTIYKAWGFYLIHNHPQLSSSPSRLDRIFTKEILIECKKKGIQFLDHIIVGMDGYYSFKKEKNNDFSC